MMSSSAGASELDIRFGSATIDRVLREERPYRVGYQAFEFVMPGVARYHCSKNRIVIDPARAASEDDIAAMLIATALPAYLWACGDVMLHAAAVLLPGASRAVAAMGPSGSGKSTMLARAVEAGALVIADDSLRVRRSGDCILASGLPGGWFDPLVADSTVRRLNPVTTAAQLAEHELGCIIVLNWNAGHTGVLPNSEAVRALLDNRHRPRIARLLGREAAMLPQIAAICRSAGILAHPSIRF